MQIYKSAGTGVWLVATVAKAFKLRAEGIVG